VDGDAHWRSISRDNVLTVYGLDANSRIADPENPYHVFSWLICRSYDDKGNAIIYDHEAEDDRGVDLDLPSEQRRSRAANRYLKRIRYGNIAPLLIDPGRPSFRQSHLAEQDLEATGWMFSLVFDYGEERYREEPAGADGRVLAHADIKPRRPWRRERTLFPPSVPVSRSEPIAFAAMS
jgi:hypothetical protein